MEAYLRQYGRFWEASGYVDAKEQIPTVSEGCKMGMCVCVGGVVFWLFQKGNLQSLILAAYVQNIRGLAQSIVAKTWLT